MTRRRYVYDEELGKMVELTPQRESMSARDRGALWNDRHYNGMQATDGTDISTRARHRAYMKRHGVTTADDFSSTWSKARESREKYYQQGGSFSKKDIQQAIQQLSRR